MRGEVGLDKFDVGDVFGARPGFFHSKDFRKRKELNAFDHLESSRVAKVIGQGSVLPKSVASFERRILHPLACTVGVLADGAFPATGAEGFFDGGGDEKIDVVAFFEPENSHNARADDDNFRKGELEVLDGGDDVHGGIQTIRGGRVNLYICPLKEKTIKMNV